MQCATVFEVCDAPRRPALAEQTEYKLKWKDGARRQGTAYIADDIDFDEIQKTKDFQIARKIMIELRRCNVLETMVSRDNLPVVKKFFKENLDNPTPKVIEIIDHAMETCYKEVMFHQERYDLYIDSDMREFLLNKEKAKQCLLDVILICPEFIPLMWGGESVGLPSDEEVTKVSTDSKEEILSPWRKAVKKAGVNEVETKLVAIRKPPTKGGLMGSMELVKSWEKRRSGSDSRSEKSSSEYTGTQLTERLTKSQDSIDDERIWTNIKKPVAKSVEKARSRISGDKWKEVPKKSSGLLARMKQAVRRRKSVTDKTHKSTHEERVKKGGSEEAPKSTDSEERSKEGGSGERVIAEENMRRAREREKQARTRMDNVKTGRENIQYAKSVGRRLKHSTDAVRRLPPEEAQKSSDSAEKSREDASAERIRRIGSAEKTMFSGSAEGVLKTRQDAKTKADNLKTGRETMPMPMPMPRRLKSTDNAMRKSKP